MQDPGWSWARGQRRTTCCCRRPLLVPLPCACLHCMAPCPRARWAHVCLHHACVFALLFIPPAAAFSQHPQSAHHALPGLKQPVLLLQAAAMLSQATLACTATHRDIDCGQQATPSSCALPFPTSQIAAMLPLALGLLASGVQLVTEASPGGYPHIDTNKRRAEEVGMCWANLGLRPLNAIGHAWLGCC